nr:putative squalene synthetase [Tanacetum cinerariifolium]
MAVGGSGWRRRRRLEEDGGDWDDDELLGYIGLEEDDNGGLLGYMSTYKILFDLSCFTSYASGKEDMFPDPISNSMGLFLQKTNIIRDYLEDIDEMPRSRMFWPRQIWSKYVNKLEVVLNGDSALPLLYWDMCVLLSFTAGQPG